MTANLWALLIFAVAVGIAVFALIMIGRRQERSKMEKESQEVMLRVIQNADKLGKEIEDMTDDELDKLI